MNQNTAYQLYPGCMIRSRLPHLEKSARAAFARLGFEMTEAPGLGCCPNPVNFKDMDRDAWLTLAVRNLAVLKNSGRPVMTLCSGCYSSFQEAEHLLSKDRVLADRVRRNVGETPKETGPEWSVEHFARLIYEKIGPEKLAEMVVRPLRGLKLAFHYGCHFLRPRHIHRGFDDTHHPTRMEALVEALGAEAVDYSRKMLCCGQTVMAVDQKLSLNLGFEKLRLIKETGAQAIVLICPSCMLQFDFNQKLMEKTFETDLGIPVFYLTELVALALGESPDSLGLNLHRVNVLPLLEKIGLRPEAEPSVEKKGI